MKMRDIVAGPRFADGNYDVTIKHVTHEVSSTNKPKLQFEAVTPDGRSIKWSRSLQPQALWSLGTDLVTLGAVDEEAEISDDVEERVRFLSDTAKELEGRSVTIVVSTREGDNGKKYSDVTFAQGQEVAAGDALARI